MLIEYRDYPDFEQLPIRRLLAAVNERLLQQGLRLAKHYWGDNQHIYPIDPADYGLHQHDSLYPIAVYPGAPNRPLEEMLLMYGVRRTRQHHQAKLSVEVIFPMEFQPEMNGAHADYFENVVRQLQQSGYPLLRQYHFVADTKQRRTITELGLFDYEPLSEQEIEALATALKDVYTDFNKIFTS